jgi:hypothetical protein
VFFRLLGVKLYRVEEDALSLVTGSGWLSLIVFLLCTIHGARKGIFTAVVLVSLIVGISLTALRPSSMCFAKLRVLWRITFLVPFLVFGTLYLFNAMAPETSPDGATYHLGNVLRWWHHRGFTSYSGSMYADLPQGLEMLFLFAFSFGRHSAASLVHFGFLITLPVLVLCYGRRFGMTAPSAMGAVLVFLSPIAGTSGTSAYNDVAVACVIFALFYVLQIWDDTSDNRLLCAAGLLGGFGYAIKYTAGIAVLYALGFVIWRLRHHARTMWRPLATVSGFAAILATPWVLKNWILVGNPFSPFLNSWFPNNHIHISFEHQYRASMALYLEIQSRWQLPWLWSISGAYVSGLFGPWMLVWPLALLALRRREGARLVTAALFFGLIALANCSTRFLLPSAAFVGSALGMLLPCPSISIPAAIAIDGIISWPTIVTNYCDPYAWRLKDIPFKAALRITPEEVYLRSKMDRRYEMPLEIEKVVPENDRVLTLPSLAQAYTTRQLWNSYESAQAELAVQALWVGYDRSRQPDWELKFAFPAQAIHGIRVVQTSRDNEPWSVSELRVFGPAGEIPRRSGWHLTAYPNFWDVARAFDANEASSWSTWQALEPGMYIQLNFGQGVVADSVSLYSTTGGWIGKFQLWGLRPVGDWQVLSAAPKFEKYTPLPTNMRRAAIDEVKSLSFHYVVADCNDGLGKDLLDTAECWGVSCLRRVGNACLFRVE